MYDEVAATGEASTEEEVVSGTTTAEVEDTGAE